jgi:hypothetical protein
MAFNKKTWSKDYTGTGGLRKLAKEEGLRKYGSKYKAPKKKEA